MVWEEEDRDGLADKISELLKSREVKYTSVDIVHAGSEEEEEEERPLPVILWISVTRGWSAMWPEKACPRLC